MFLATLVSLLVSELFLYTTHIFAVSNDIAEISDFNSVLTKVLTVALGLVGTIAGVMIVVAGFKFLTAGGDKEASGKARMTLTFAVIGLLVAVCSWLILNLLGIFLGVNFNQFNVML
jgi:hypothetical protein